MNLDPVTGMPKGGTPLTDPTVEHLDNERAAEVFAACQATPSMRSVTAILRITREGLRRDESLQHHPKMAVGLTVFTILVALGSSFLMPEGKPWTMTMLIGGAIVSAMLWYGVLTSVQERRFALERRRELLRLASEALDEMLAAKFQLKELTREQTETLRDLIRAHPERTRLKSLL